MAENPHPTPGEIAILKTLLYGDVFDFPLTVPEIHHYMIGHAANIEQVRHTLETSTWLAQHIVRCNGYYAARPETADLRDQRHTFSAELWKVARRYGLILAHLPFVRMVALTGALAMHNARHPREDLDFLIVTVPGRVWLVRLMAVALVRLARIWGVELCPNYVLSENQLLQQRQDLYVAHELTQMVPISGHGLYARMRGVNEWADALMPNAKGVLHPTPPHTPQGLGRIWQRACEWLLGGRLGDALDTWERRRKAPRFQAESAQSPHSTAVIDAEQVKGHFNDYGHPTLQRFYDKLKAYEIADQ